MNKDTKIITCANSQKFIQLCIRGRWVALQIPQVIELQKGVAIVGKA